MRRIRHDTPEKAMARLNPQAILSGLLRVKVLFQARAIAAVMGASL